MKKTVKIQGMYCPNCEKRIAAALSRMEGVKSVRVDYVSGEAVIESRGPLRVEEVDALLRKLGYEAAEEGGELTCALSLLVILFALTVILERTGLLNRLVPQRLGESGMSYGLFFVTGLLTSVHCVAMCGGINLAQSAASAQGPTSISYSYREIRTVSAAPILTRM